MRRWVGGHDGLLDPGLGDEGGSVRTYLEMSISDL